MVKALACESIRLHEWGGEHYPRLYKWHFEGHRCPGIGQQCFRLAMFPASSCIIFHHIHHHHPASSFIIMHHPSSSFIIFHHIHPHESWIQAQTEVTMLNWIITTLQFYIFSINDSKFCLIQIESIWTKETMCNSLNISVLASFDLSQT